MTDKNVTGDLLFTVLSLILIEEETRKPEHIVRRPCHVFVPFLTMTAMDPAKIIEMRDEEINKMRCRKIKPRPVQRKTASKKHSLVKA